MPNEVIFPLPAQVLNAVFSTSPRPTIDLLTPVTVPVNAGLASGANPLTLAPAGIVTVPVNVGLVNIVDLLSLVTLPRPICVGVIEIFVEPSNEFPAIVTGVANLVEVAAFPKSVKVFIASTVVCLLVEVPLVSTTDIKVVPATTVKVGNSDTLIDIIYPITNVNGIPPETKLSISLSSFSSSSLPADNNADPFNEIGLCGPAILPNLLRASPSIILQTANV